MNIEIANRLQKLRKEKGYSQEELADALGISRQAVSKWERAESSPDTDNLIILARLYNMSLDELLYDSESDEEIKQRIEDKESSKKDGLYITDDEGQTLKLGKDSVEFFDKDGNKVTRKDYKRMSKAFYIVKDAVTGAAFLGALIAYILLGIFAGAWAYGWTTFLGAICIGAIFDNIEYRKLTYGGYVFLVVIAYILIGFLAGGWHPYWFLFITIPVYYIVFGAIDKLIKSHNPNWDLNSKEDDDKDEDIAE